MLGIVLLVVGGVGLLLTLLALVGADIGDFDFDLGDSGVGLTSLLTPFLTGFGLLAGGLIVFGGVSTGAALLTGALVGLVLAAAAGLVLRWLWRSSQELPDVEVLGNAGRIVEPVGAGRFGTAEVATELGHRQVTVTADRDFAHNARIRIVAKIDDRDAYVVEQLPFSELDD